MVEKGLSERRALVVARMSASALRYEPRPDHNVELREQIAVLAPASTLRRGHDPSKIVTEGACCEPQARGAPVSGAGLQVHRRKRKKVPVVERQPSLRPSAANQLWSIDFVFDRTAEGRVIKCLTIVDDATHEAVAIEVERAISGQGVARVLDRLAVQRGLL
jgi:transposase InsO family protein